MTIAQARLILIEHNQWRRGEVGTPYDSELPVPFPHSARDVGIAIDTLVKATEGMK